MESVLIGAYGLSKKYAKDKTSMMRYGAADALRAGFGLQRPQYLRKGEFWSLRDINLEVRRGQVLGICGHNGAGKTTLLKTLTGLLQPDLGEVAMCGRISWLVDIGAGLNPNLTGRENVLLRTEMLSARPRQAALLRYVDEFTGLGDFLDSPVRFYSSGMKAKLGFAIATMMAPDILIVDETLAVGDLGFRMKCYQRISEIASEAAVLFVSHGMNHVARICTHGLYLDHGRIGFIGDVQETIRLYNEAMTTDASPNGHGFNSHLVRIVALNGKAVRSGDVVRCNDPLSIRFAVSNEIGDRKVFHLLARDLAGNPVMDADSRSFGFDGAGMELAECRIADLALSPDIYDLSVMVNAPDGRHLAISESVRVRAEGRFGSAVAYKPKANWQSIREDVA